MPKGSSICYCINEGHFLLFFISFICFLKQRTSYGWLMCVYEYATASSLLHLLFMCICLQQPAWSLHVIPLHDLCKFRFVCPYFINLYMCSHLCSTFLIAIGVRSQPYGLMSSILWILMLIACPFIWMGWPDWATVYMRPLSFALCIMFITQCQHL